MRLFMQKKILGCHADAFEACGQRLLRSPFEGLGVTPALYAILFCLFISVNALAQSDYPVQIDTIKKFMIIDAKPINKNEKILYVIDGKLYYKASIKKDIDAKNIFNVEILKPNEALTKYGDQGKKGAIIIISKKFAIGSYQAKLSSFSKDYKAYLSAHQNKDDDFEYEINGSTLGSSSYDNIMKLYKIPIKSIKRVDFLKNPSYNRFPGKTKIVNISTED